MGLNSRRGLGGDNRLEQVLPTLQLFMQPVPGHRAHGLPPGWARYRSMAMQGGGQVTALAVMAKGWPELDTRSWLSEPFSVHHTLDTVDIEPHPLGLPRLLGFPTLGRDVSPPGHQVRE